MSRSHRLPSILGGALPLFLALPPPVARAEEGTPFGSRPDIDSRYFQQGVRYTIEATLDTKTDVIHGEETLVYTNQSADTLRVVWFHLTQNAYRPGSLLDDQQRSEGDYSLASLKPEEWAGTAVTSLRDGAGNALEQTEEETFLRVRLARPLLPGASEEFRLGFDTRFGKPKRRMQKGDDFYTASQWYPAMVVYDARRGWNLDPHMGKEFYGDFGSYDWTLTLPAHYIVDGSGVLTNEAEVLPQDLRARLDLSHFATKPKGEAASVILPPTEETKTWRFHADQVHNVAWTASPNFRIGELEWEGIRCIALAREQHAAGWQDAAEVCRAYVADYSRRWGRYRYPKMIVADVESGMEYPMFTADGGMTPEYITLFGHEIAHNWFYGMIGSNETYRALLDEGFTNYICAATTDSIWGEASGTMWTGRYARRFYPTMSNDFERNDIRYLRFVRAGYERDPLETGSNDFDEYQSYRMVYQKTSIMLRQLEQMLGRDVMTRVMRTYFDRFCFQHPYPEDFRRVAEEVSGRSLGDYFDAWLERNWRIDYAVKRVRNEQRGADLLAVIDLERKEAMPMPLELRLDLEGGGTQWVLVPGREGVLKRPAGWFIAEPWRGWRDVRPRHRIEVPVPHPVRRVTIDPECRLADVDRLNNRTGLPAVRLHLDNLFVYTPSLDALDYYARPSLRWNGVDGPKLGAHLFGGYLLTEFTRQHHLEAAARYGFRSRQVEWSASVEEPVPALGPLTHGFLRAEETDGRVLREVGIDAVRRARLYLPPVDHLRLLFRHSQSIDREYLPRGFEWSRGVAQSVLADYRRDWRARGRTGWHALSLETSAFGSDRDWSTLEATLVTAATAAPSTRFRLHAAGQTGSPPQERALRAGEATTFDAVRSNWLLAARGTLPLGREWGRLTAGGGANLRSLAARPLSSQRVDRLVAINVEQEMVDLPAAAIRKLTCKGQRLWPRFYTLVDAAWLRSESSGVSSGGISDSTFSVQPLDGEPRVRGARRWSFRGEVGIGGALPLTRIPSSLGVYTLRVDWTPITYSNRGLDRVKWSGALWVIGLGRAWD